MRQTRRQFFRTAGVSIGATTLGGKTWRALAQTLVRPAPNIPEPRFIQTNGIRMGVYEVGEGMPIVFCHGFPELAYSWRHQMSAFSEAGYRAIAPDQRGYGLTDRPADASAVELRQHGVTFEQEPAVPEGGRTSAKRAFVAGPDNVRLALVETGFAGVDVDLGAAILTTDALAPYGAPRTPWGAPDFQGIWTSSSAVGIPFERPADADANGLTAEEAVARHEGRLLGGIWGYEREWRDTTLGYSGVSVSTQVAMVIDPPDGHLPPRTSTGEELAAAAGAARAAAGPPAGPEDLSPWVRCITRGLIPTPGGYNNGLQIVQGPGYVAITREMVHETRVIPTEPQPTVGSDVESYLGRWSSSRASVARLLRPACPDSQSSADPW